jgi:hypothetical protein
MDRTTKRCFSGDKPWATRTVMFVCLGEGYTGINSAMHLPNHLAMILVVWPKTVCSMVALRLPVHRYFREQHMLQPMTPGGGEALWEHQNTELIDYSVPHTCNFTTWYSSVLCVQSTAE